MGACGADRTLGATVAGGDRRGADSALIAVLASGATVKDAAKQVGVGERTVRRRLENGDFRRRVAEARGMVLERAAGRLADATVEAAETLRSLLSSDSDSVRHSAAKTLLEQAVKGTELLDLASRIEQLERAAEAEENFRRRGG